MRHRLSAIVLSTLVPLAAVAQSEWTEVEDDTFVVPSLGLSVGEVDGMPVMTEAGERVGELDDVLIEPGTDVIAFTLDIGGFLGLGEKDVLVPIEGITLVDGELITDLTREEFERMPDFED